RIYLGVEELALLDRVARATGASRSELVRRAVRSAFGEKTREERLRALEVSAGSWSGRSFTGGEYVDAIRGDLAEEVLYSTAEVRDVDGGEPIELRLDLAEA